MNSQLKLYLWLVLAMFFFGASWPIAKALSAYLTEHEFISYCYLITTLSMMPVLWWMKLSFKIDIKNLIVASISALLLIFFRSIIF